MPNLFDAAPSLKPDARSSMGAMQRALVLDDSETDRLRLARMVRSAELDLQMTEAATIADFASKLDGPAFDIIFLDYRLVQGDGLIALEMLRRHPLQSSVPSIMIAGEGQIQIAIDALKNGCRDYLMKDKMTPELLARAVSAAIETSELRASLSAEEELRSSMQNSLGRFASSCGAEMRTILSAMLRRTRSMKRNPGALTPVEIAGLETSCERLWDFLEEFQTFVSEAAMSQPAEKEQRLN